MKFALLALQSNLTVLVQEEPLQISINAIAAVTESKTMANNVILTTLNSPQSQDATQTAHRRRGLIAQRQIMI